MKRNYKSTSCQRNYDKIYHGNESKKQQVFQVLSLNVYIDFGNLQIDFRLILFT